MSLGDDLMDWREHLPWKIVELPLIGRMLGRVRRRRGLQLHGRLHVQLELVLWFRRGPRPRRWHIGHLRGQDLLTLVRGRTHPW